VLLALNVASIATWALFNVMLPTLFGILSIVFGRSFRRTGLRMDQIGRRGRAHLERIVRHVATPADSRRDWHRRPAQSASAEPRVRVPEGVKTRVDDVAEAENEASEEAEQAPAPRSAKRRPL
jgi:hypothetical protein